MGENVYLSSTILAVDRSEAKVLVQTASACLVLIKSTKLVFKIPPKLNNLHGRDLSSSERTLFQQFSNSGYYTALLRNTGIWKMCHKCLTLELIRYTTCQHCLVYILFNKVVF